MFTASCRVLVPSPSAGAHWSSRAAIQSSMVGLVQVHRFLHKYLVDCAHDTRPWYLATTLSLASKRDRRRDLQVPPCRLGTRLLLQVALFTFTDASVSLNKGDAQYAWSSVHSIKPLAFRERARRISVLLQWDKRTAAALASSYWQLATLATLQLAEPSYRTTPRLHAT